jgi:hypothetical protein
LERSSAFLFHFVNYGTGCRRLRFGHGGDGGEYVVGGGDAAATVHFGKVEVRDGECAVHVEYDASY